MRELFSRRQAIERGEINDSLIHDYIPSEFRSRFYMIIKTLYSSFVDYAGYDRTGRFFRDEINKNLAMAFGDLSLDLDNYLASLPLLLKFMNKCNDEMFIDAVDLILGIFHSKGSIYIRRNVYNRMFPDAIEQTNQWMKYSNLGYRFENGQLIKITNEHLHQEVVIPALKLLSDERFSAANSEFNKSNKHRRAGDYEAAIIDAGRAFESVMKVICKIRCYQYDENGTANSLLKTLKDNNYYPSFLENQLNSLNSVLLGLPTLRNKAAHDQGEQGIAMYDNYAGYALHLLSSNTVFLISLLPK